MAKAKSPKLHPLSLFTSFQICRPKRASSMIKTPYMLSPLNSKTFDISFPAPPPTTPSKIVPLLDCRLSSSFACSHDPNTRDKTHHSPHSTDSDDGWRPVLSSRNDKNKHKNTKQISKSSIRSRSTTSSSRDNSTETESLFSSPPSVNTSAHHPLKTVYEEKQPKTQRFKRYGSKEWREGEEECEEKKKVMPCMSEKVEQSFVVVKKSEDPYEDFKRSMSEMIVEKQIFEPRELEELLMSFLSLNSRLHHKVIIEAFTEILKEVFCG